MRDARQAAEFPHLEPVIKEYGSALRIALHLHHPPRPFSRPRQESGFHLHLFALPRRLPWLSVLADPPILVVPIAFSHPLDRCGRLTPTFPGRMPKGITLRDDEGGVLAYMHQRNIFVLFDLAGQAEDLAPLLLRHLLDRSFELMEGDLAAQSGLHPDRVRFLLAGLRRTTELQKTVRQDRRKALTRSQFQQATSDRVTDEIGFLEAEVRSTEEALEAGSLRITADTRHLQACRRRLRRLRGELLQDEDDVTRELDLLHQLSDVADVTASRTGLRILTRAIQAEHGGKVYALGTFQIDFSYSGEITIRNLTSRHGYYDHPHIWDGNACLGNIREGLAKLIGEFQLAAASEVLLDFLKTINPKDWHVSIERWREIPDTGQPGSPMPGTLKHSR